MDETSGGEWQQEAGTGPGTDTCPEEGRPAREHAIQHDDITNLQIALHTSRTLEEFLGSV